MRTNMRPMLWPLLALCLGGCTQPQPPAALVAQALAAPATSPPAPTTPAADTEIVIALARHAASRAAREQTLHVQAQLRARAREDRQAQQAAQRGDGNERCIAGQKMRRVANGWVQAGTC
jgi:hypothetical protein